CDEASCDRVGDVDDPRGPAEEPVERGEVGAVADRVVAPRVPLELTADDAIVGVAVALGDAMRAEVVVVPVPDRVPGERAGDEEPERETHNEERDEEASRLQTGHDVCFSRMRRK